MRGTGQSIVDSLENKNQQNQNAGWQGRLKDASEMMMENRQELVDRGRQKMKGEQMLKALKNMRLLELQQKKLYAQQIK